MENLVIEDAKLIFKNFTGREEKFNRAGDRNFCVIIEDANVAEQLKEDGWNVRMLRPRDEQEDIKYYLPVAVKFENRPPNIYLVTNKNKTLLDEETVGTLDYADIKNVDMTINPYQWSMSDGKSGVKAYLKSMYAVIEEDAFADKYRFDEDNQSPADDCPF